MTVETINAITLGLLLGTWPVYLAWEVYLLVKRAGGWPKPALISGVAKTQARRWNSLPYIWGGMGAHWFLTHAWATVPGSIVFWVLLLALLVVDVVLLARGVAYEVLPSWAKWVRHPAAAYLAGNVAGFVLFPQAA